MAPTGVCLFILVIFMKQDMPVTSLQSNACTKSSVL